MDEKKCRVRKKYLTEEKFESFMRNDFFHVVKDLAKIKGMMYVIIPVLCAILGFLIVLASRGI